MVYFSKYCEKNAWNMNILIPTNCKGGENIPEMLPSSHLKLPHSFFQGVIMNQPQPFFKFNKSLFVTKACLLLFGKSGRIRPIRSNLATFLGWQSGSIPVPARIPNPVAHCTAHFFTDRQTILINA